MVKAFTKILILCVFFVFFRLNKLYILINQFNNLDLIIEENTLKHIESLI